MQTVPPTPPPEPGQTAGEVGTRGAVRAQAHGRRGPTARAFPRADGAGDRAAA
jgi:hypothetical protein